jgi:hypothetical protein
VHSNISQEIVVTTVDKIELCLRDYQETLRARGDWITPAGILIALLAPLVTADFKVFLGISAEIWLGLHVTGSAVSFVWFLYAVFRAIQVRGKDNPRHIIQELKRERVDVSLEQQCEATR